MKGITYISINLILFNILVNDAIIIIYLIVGNNATIIIIGVNNKMDAIIKAIEDYIQVVTSRKCNALDDALSSLESLEGDLDGIITDIKECIEGRV